MAIRLYAYTSIRIALQTLSVVFPFPAFHPLGRPFVFLDAVSKAFAFSR